MESYCIRGYAEALEVIPYTLAENAGLSPISVVTELRKRHSEGEKNAGINVRKVLQQELRVVQILYSLLIMWCVQGTISDIVEENVVQPLLVSTSMIQLATETVRSIMKIDDIVRCLLIVATV